MCGSGVLETPTGPRIIPSVDGCGDVPGVLGEGLEQGGRVVGQSRDLGRGYLPNTFYQPVPL